MSLAGYHDSEELTIWYGDWDDFFEDKDVGARPGRKVEWLEKHGWCIDHVEIRDSTMPGAGRGAFMKRAIREGEVVMPAPLQVFENRDIFQKTVPEQLYVNYCLQPEKSNMVFFPYGPAVGAINHSKKLANVRYQWSSHPLHRADMLEMNYRQFWENIYPGALILEVVALRDLIPGEELFMDYGKAWEDAWKKHVDNWQPTLGADEYTYPEDMDDTEPLRTVKEQEINPYPKNLMTMCATPDHEREEKSQIEWYEPEGELAEYFVFCHILERSLGNNGHYEYDVSLMFYKKNNEPFTPKEYEFDKTQPKENLYVSSYVFANFSQKSTISHLSKQVDFRVPRRAIRWVEKPYLDDEHLENVFRHPIVFPSELVPQAWETAESRKE